MITPQLTPFMNLILNRFRLTLTFWSGLVVLILLGVASFARQPLDPIRADLKRLGELNALATKSPDKKLEATQILERINRSDHKTVAQAFVDSVTEADSRKVVFSYAQALPKLSGDVRSAVLKKLGAETDAIRKAKLIGGLSVIEGPDVVKALFPLLDNREKAEIAGAPWTDRFRVCDHAYNRIYLLVRRVRELGLNAGPEMSDAIQTDVPIEWRDARIAKLKQRLIAKFGSNLDFPSER
jgi:hypothetical protein